VSPSAPAAPAGAPLPAGTRCGVHPVRRAVDRCPVCARPRCAADAQDAPGGGCPACQGVPPGAGAVVRQVPALESVVRAALAATAVALLGGVVAAEYVDAQLFAYLTPFVVGVLTAAAAQTAAGGARTGTAAMRVRAVAIVYALLGVGLGFALERSKDALEASTLLPYLAATAGVVLWTLPPKERAAPDV
jgi:hypothetical protein